jgi:hypothetical protein
MPGGLTGRTMKLRGPSTKGIKELVPAVRLMRRRRWSAG